MSTNNLSKETETRLMDFFNNRINPNSMAKTLRQVNLTLALGALSEEESILQNANKLANSFYWLNELA
jgi:hypothetical protein